jgi:hypothetical protein
MGGEPDRAIACAELMGSERWTTSETWGSILLCGDEMMRRVV